MFRLLHGPTAMDAPRFMPGRRAVLLAFCAAAAAPGAAAAAEATDPSGAHVALFKKVSPSVVGIESLGSGVIISPEGLILTSASAVPPRDRVNLFFADGKRRAGKVAARDDSRDLALVRIDPPASGLPVVGLAGKEPPLGRTVYTLGNAFLALSRDGQVAMSVGIVSGSYDLPAQRSRGRPVYTGRVIEVTAAVNQGMSGAPVVDREGLLVGLVTLNLDKTRWLGAAIPLEVIRPAIEDLKAGRAPSPARAAPAPGAEGYFGAEVEDAADGGVAVAKVEKNSPAERIDVRAGDRIVEFNGRTIDSKEDLQDALADLQPGAQVHLTLERGTETLEKMVELGKPPAKDGSK